MANWGKTHHEKSKSWGFWAGVAGIAALICAAISGEESGKAQVEDHVRDELKYYKEEAAYSKEMWEKHLRWIENN